MSACPQCGTVAKPTDKFCNTCGTPIVRQTGGQPAAYPGAPAASYGAGPGGGGGGGGGFGGPPGGFPAPARCQMGHEIAPGQSYCPQGHPIAMDAMQFSQDAYGQPPQQYGQPGYGQQPQYGQQGGYSAPQPGPNPYGGAPQGQGFPPPQQQPANLYAQQQPGAFGQQPQPGFDQGAAQQAPAPAAQALPANALRGFLVTYQSNTKGDFWPLYGGRVTIGRSSAGDQVDIPLADATISSRHAMIVVDGASGSVSVEDTGSTNGTYVNEEHLGFNGRRDLRDGDRVRFGGFTTIVKLIGRV